ncbi:MAG: DUF2848 family protein [Bacillota bacterium]
MVKTDFFVSRKENEDYVLSYEIEKLICVGFSGRNQEEVLKHVEELEEEGITAPEQLPTIYPCSKTLSTYDDEIQVISEKSSGEVEVILLFKGDDIYLGLGSDHTDRALETVDIGKSKQSCPKPHSRILWKMEDVKDHLDDLKLKSWSIENGEKELYQEGTMEGLLPLDEIINFVKENYQENLEGTVVFCGSVPMKSGMAFGDRFELELEDPVLGRKISHKYSIKNIR